MDTWLKPTVFPWRSFRRHAAALSFQTGQASFQYTDKILEGWKKKEVRTWMISALWTVNKKRRQNKKNPPGNPQTHLRITVSTIFSSESMILMNTKSIC